MRYIVKYQKPDINENVLYIINPKGEIVLEHYKYGGNIFEGTVCGDKRLKYVDTEYGRVSGIICWDKDFLTVVNQIGKMDVDILFIPTADWKQISPAHTIMGNFRGIENGTNVVTQAVNGMSMIANYKGEVLESMDHFTTDQWVMRGFVPTKGGVMFYCKYVYYTEVSLNKCYVCVLSSFLTEIFRWV